MPEAGQFGQTGAAKVVRQPVGASFQFAEGDDRAGRMKDDSGLVGAQMLANLHAQTVQPPNLTGVKGLG